MMLASLTTYNVHVHVHVYNAYVTRAYTYINHIEINHRDEPVDHKKSI